MSLGNLLKLIISIAVAEAAGLIGSTFTAPSIPGWYAQLSKPSIAPPNWVFAPVWFLLFALMGIALFLVWRSYGKTDDLRVKKIIKIAVFAFAIQLVLNVLWSVIFFGYQNPKGAFIEIIFLWLAILATIILFSKISKTAAWLLVPYIVWVTFAGYLNFSIWQLSTVSWDKFYCAQDAKLCPDGSYVGRVAPKCDFAECPSLTANWKTFSDNQRGFSFKYPESFGMTYVGAFDWPPQVQILNEEFSCTEGGSEIARAGRTSKQTINGRDYCATKLVEGAAGSTYTQYAYVFPKNSRTVIFTFSTRAPQCLNYDDPRKTECQTEQSSFAIEGIVDLMAQSFVLQ